MTHSVLFEKALKEVLRWEGGYNYHPNDSGGQTNFGISLKFYRENIDPMADENTIKGLTKEDAADIYYKFFWKPNNYDALPYTVAKRVFNFTVNMGARRSHKLLQRAIWAATEKPIKVDGIIGQETLERLAAADPYCVRAALNSEAAGRYRYLAEKNPKLRVFLNGWIARGYNT